MLAACAGPQPVPYTGLASSAYLRPASGEGAGRTPYRYDGAVDWSQYRSAILEPVAIYQGADNQFGTMSGEARAALAHHAQAAFAQALQRRFTLVTEPAADTIRIKVTLTGAATSTQVLSTLAHVDIGGMLYNGVQAARGKGGLMTGWVMDAVEITDAESGRLLLAYEEKQYPNAFNPMPTFGALAAARAGLDKAADGLAARLQ
ncbi:lipoprotein [Acidisoma sp. 7E03]